MDMFDQQAAFDFGSLLQRSCSAEELFAYARQVTPAEIAAKIDSDYSLVRVIYESLAFHIKDQTYFSIASGSLMAICVQYFGEADNFYEKMTENTNIISLPAHELSLVYFGAVVSGKFDRLFERLESMIRADGEAGIIHRDTITAVRSLITITNLLYNSFPSPFAPEVVKSRVRDLYPLDRFRNLVASLDEIAKSDPTGALDANLFSKGKDQIILFALEDFVNDRLNTLTKLYCDYFYVIAKYTDLKIVVRIFNIYQNFSTARIPSVWDPPRGPLSDLMSFYFGEEGVDIAARIDFEYVDCWASKEDYIAVVDDVIRVINPSVAITCIDKHYSFLERILYRSVPLLQFEVINNSGFVRSCDGLVPNGAVTPQREADFDCHKAPLPQIPFPVQAPVSKEQLGVDPDAFLVAVIGKQFPTRMLQEGNLNLSYRFCHAVSDMLDLHDKMRVIFIGENREKLVAWISEAGAKMDMSKVIIEEFIYDLRAHMQACDLIVNPPIFGGGRSIAIAITDKMPTLIFKHADAENFVPKSNVCENLADFIIKAERYLEVGPGHRENYITERGYAPFSDEYNRMSAIEFAKACRLSREAGLKRLSARSAP